jgi:hypothetical protein
LIIRSAGAGETFGYNDKMAIGDFLLRLVNSPPLSLKEREKYSRKRLTNKISDSLRLSL